MVHFDIEPSQFGRVIDPTVAVAGDCKDALKILLPLVKGAPQAERDGWLQRCGQLKESYPFSYTPAPDGKLKTQSVIEALYHGLKPVQEKLVVSTGVGNHQMMACQFIRWIEPRSIVTSDRSARWAGLPLTGAQVANPDKTVLLIDGDGSFNMTLNDLGTVLENRCP